MGSKLLLYRASPAVRQSEEADLVELALKRTKPTNLLEGYSIESHKDFSSVFPAL